MLLQVFIIITKSHRSKRKRAFAHYFFIGGVGGNRTRVHRRPHNNAYSLDGIKCLVHPLYTVKLMCTRFLRISVGVCEPTMLSYPFGMTPTLSVKGENLNGRSVRRVASVPMSGSLC